VSRAAGRKPLIAGNWKMHNTHFEAIALTQKLAFMLTAKDFDATDVAVLPPFTALRSVQTLIEGDRLRLAYGAQDISPHDDGAYTGDVSGRMLAKLGCQYVLAGHSERRRYHGEDDALINAKAQLDAGLAGLPGEQVAGLVIAYEPVWAIGTGEVATPEDAEEMCAGIRERLLAVHGDVAAAGVRILYGGSVKSGNMAAIMAQPDIDGGLVGGASLDAAEFVRICRYRELSATI